MRYFTTGLRHQPKRTLLHATVFAISMFLCSMLVLRLTDIYFGGSSLVTSVKSSAPPSISLPRQLLRFQRETGAGVTFQIIHGQEAVWELPQGRKPTGVVLFGHGCYHSGGDLWPPQPACPRCLGLPEEIRWRRAALARGLAVVGISSQDRVGRGCWFEVKKDKGASAAKVARAVIEKAGLSDLPVYVMGVSGGAYMSMTLPQTMPELRGVYAQVRALPVEAFKLPGNRKYPPIAFVHMATRDPENAIEVEKDMEVLKAAGTPVAQVLIEPQPLTIEFLTSRSEGAVDVPMAKNIIASLKEHGYIDEKNNVKYNMRAVTNRWAPIIQPLVGNLSLQLDKSNLGELFNVAWARHEFVHDHVDAVLEWLQNGGKGGQAQMDKLLEADRQKDAAAAAAWAKALRDGGWL